MIKNAHQFLWRVKGRLPTWAILAPILAAQILFGLGPFMQHSFSILLFVIILVPLAVCLFLAYTYWAVSIPLLYSSYLGFLFPDLYPSLATYAKLLGIIGGTALILGIISEFIHGKGKKAEILTRYGISRVPWKIYVICGTLGGVGIVINMSAGTLEADDFVVITIISIIQLLYGLFLRHLKKSRPNS